ncbi:MAG: putative rane protein [Pseudonocardiales bacterium]|nr:putative rane protein [Pseudonocardiales bacterium]
MSPGARVPTAAGALAALLFTTGIWHFASPRGFESIVPRFLGSPAFWVRLSGVGELACAVGLVISRTRRPAAWASAALFVVVFPANIDMAVHAWQGNGSKVIAYARLPLQIPLVLWAIYIARARLGRVPE